MLLGSIGPPQVIRGPILAGAPIRVEHKGKEEGQKATETEDRRSSEAPAGEAHSYRDESDD